VGSIYTAERYLTRGKFSQKKFEAECLAEYAQTFPTVCGDFAFYQFPTTGYWRQLFESAPSLRFAFKVPEHITVPVWPDHSRYGQRAGKINDDFLNADLLARAFARELEPYRDRTDALIFEFGTFAKKTFADAGAFTARLDEFLGKLPGGFRYAVEIRNKEYLGPEYFGMLRSHNVSHVFNAWTRMPELGTQIAMPGAFTADFAVVRALLRHGLSYEFSVDSYQPYSEVKNPDPAARDALRQIVERARRTKEAALVFVNNRLEGNAPSTIEAVIENVQ
jgi:uncharacterized protein YecE (DUF72 family)